MQPRARRPLTGLATGGLVAALFYLAILILSPLIWPQVDPFAEGLSVYAIGPLGFLKTAAFAVLGLGSIMLALAFRSARVASRWSAVGAGLLAIAGAAAIGLAVFPMDAPGQTTTSGQIHGNVGPIASLSMIAAVLVLAVAFRRDERWRSLSAPSFLLGALALVGALSTRFAQDNPELGLPVGLLMRLLVAPLVVWSAIAAIRLRRIGRSAGA